MLAYRQGTDDPDMMIESAAWLNLYMLHMSERDFNIREFKAALEEELLYDDLAAVGNPYAAYTGFARIAQLVVIAVRIHNALRQFLGRAGVYGERVRQTDEQTAYQATQHRAVLRRVRAVERENTIVCFSGLPAITPVVVADI